MKAAVSFDSGPVTYDLDLHYVRNNEGVYESNMIADSRLITIEGVSMMTAKQTILVMSSGRVTTPDFSNPDGWPIHRFRRSCDVTVKFSNKS